MIVRRKSAAGAYYYWDTNTNKFATKEAYSRSGGGAKKSKSSGSKSSGKSTGRASAGTCSTFGKTLRSKRTSASGRSLRCKCSHPARCK
jgi:hypothetical protein